MANIKNKSIKLLPGYLQTEALTKMFSATVDHLFQPEDVSFINGYIGQKTPWYNPVSDIYISEPSASRANYQLAPTAVSVNYLNGNITNAMFYDDLIGQLEFQGGLVNNHSRLFEQEYYSWSPPIDLDKFVNFGNYYWLPQGPDVITLLNTTDLVNQLNNVENFSYNGSWQIFSTGEIVTGSLQFINGLKITTAADITPSLNGNDYYIEGVGRSIKLVSAQNELLNPGWDTKGWDIYSWDGDITVLTSQYLTIGKGGTDGNQWSLSNKWFSNTVINISKTYIDDLYAIQAFRPIIEFDSGIVLWNYGTFSRGYVDVMDISNGDIFGSMVGQPSWMIQNIPIQDGMRILVTADVHTDTNNRIYIVSGISSGAIQLTLDNTGQDPSGAPVTGDRVYIQFGLSTLEGMNAYYDGTMWTTNGQQQSGNEIPLFELFDASGNKLDDPSVYPSSTFAGSEVFSYQLSSTAPLDPYLQLSINLDQFGDYLFVNNLTTDVINYTSDGVQTSYVGDKFVQINGFAETEYVSGWYKSPTLSRQYIVNEFAVLTTATTFVIDQVPYVQEANTLPTIFVTLMTLSQTSELLVNGVDYSVSGNVVTLTNAAVTGDTVIIKSWNPVAPASITGFYEIPKNLSANPNNLPITTVSRSQILPQFIDIIENQTGIVGPALGVNNYGNTAQERGLGLTILQHRAPMLKLSLLNSTALTDIIGTQSITDPMLAMQWAQRSYVSFYNKFIQTILSIYSNVTLTGSAGPTEWINLALAKINVGKTTASPWANSGPTSTPGAYCSTEQTSPTYVPASPTRLGLTPAYQPNVFYDTSFTVPQLSIQTHDGSSIVMVDNQGVALGSIMHSQTSTTNPSQLTNPVAAAWLQFELNLFNSLPSQYSNVDSIPVLDIRTIMPGKWRTTDYTRDETLSILLPSFDKWSIAAQVNYQANTGYNTDNQFSYNYSSINDKQGQPIPGHWQGIYKWFYDTARPHLSPWEMLGFSIKPTWWDTQYGPAPYTAGNTAMWEDLRDGIIRQGARIGTDLNWARPGLLNCIPVDAQGNLLPPFLAGCVNGIPGVVASRSEWAFGDGGPIETAWTNSTDYKFSLAQAGYLMKPAKFIEYTWDIPRTEEVFSDQAHSQWIYIDTNSRRSSQQFYVQREDPAILNIGLTIPNESNLTYFGSCGFQHWVSEYVISQGYDVTSYLGNIIRGSNVQLAHKMAGYTASDSFRALVDSFGQLGYNSRLIPSENVNVYLYRSTSIGESVYSGVIIEQIANGWTISGYDNINQTFTIIPSNTTGSKNNIVIGNQSVTEYTSGLNEIQTIPYNTIFPTRQSVYDFLISYGRYLTYQGWIFDQFNSDGNYVLNWSQSAKEFLLWSQGSWNNGTFIAISPAADSVSYYKEFGNIQYINGVVSGTYPILDRAMQPILPQNINVVRDNGKISVKTTNSQGIYSLRLFATTIEHAVFFDNFSAFNDIIYDPLFDLQQQRILIYAYRTNNWDGRVDAPGYFLVQNSTSNAWTMTSNLEKTANDMRKYFNIEQPSSVQIINSTNGGTSQQSTSLGVVDQSNIANLARHLIAYQSRDYLQNLLLEDATEFEFYQGFIRQKGTTSTLTSLLRNNNIIPDNSTFEYYEEWLLRLSDYGATSLNNIIDFILPQDRVTNDPQEIRLFSNQDSDNKGSDVLDIVPNDPLIIVPPESYQNDLFTLRTSYGINSAIDLPLAGYPLLGETTWNVTNQDELLSLYSTQVNTSSPLNLHDTIWQFITPTGEWTAWRVSLALGQISQTVPSSATGQPTTILTTAPHGLVEEDICILFGISGLPSINGIYQISNIAPQSFQIDPSTFNVGTGGTIWVLSRIRFTNLFDRDSNTPPDGWINGDIAYVDDGGVVSGAWTVYRQAMNKWTQYRQQQYTVDASLINYSQIFDSVSGAKLSDVNYFDPAKGRVSGAALAEITFKTDYDPAKYTSGDSSSYLISPTEAWGSAQLGLVWWDISAVRYIDYEQSTDDYRRKNWGKLAPGTGIDVYEWIRSPIPPSDWASYVAAGTSIATNSGSFLPSGSVKNPTSSNWSQYIETDTYGNSSTYYYFWVMNSNMQPSISTRSLTTNSIAALIENPSNTGEPWFAAISSQSILIGGVTNLLNGNQVFQRINYSPLANNANVYNQWQFMRQGDAYSQPDASLWTKLANSLTTFDGLGNDVPDYHLTDLQAYGTFVRPRQTWFENRIAASELFVNTFNSLLASSVTPLVEDTSKINWVSYFNLEEEEPSQSNWNYHVQDLTQRDGLIGAIVTGQIVLVDAVSETNNLWTMWQYSTGSTPWNLIQTQTYKTSNYWEYIDWYATGFSASTLINSSVNSLIDLDNILNPVTGTIIKVLNNGNNRWQLYIYNSTQWILIGEQDGSIEVLSSVYDWAADFGGFDGEQFDSGPFDQFAGIEFSNIINGIKNAIYNTSSSIEINTLFFAMLNYVVSEQLQVDWAVKTSNIVLKGFNQPLYQYPLLPEDISDSIIGFMNEAKPYHAKIRELIIGKSSLDLASVSAVDFDQPPGYSNGIPINNGSLEWKELNETYTAWLNNYKTNPQLIRQLKTTLFFDRIATPAQRLGWSSSWGVVGWDNESASISYGAIDNIDKYYAPTPGMIPNIIAELMIGVDYRGTQLSSIGLNIQAGWGIAPWDSLIGWDPNSATIEAYLDQIVQGGQIPNYDTAIGDGIHSSFNLLHNATSPLDLVVWSDGQLRKYGVDWTVPTYATSVNIISGGLFYNIGDILDVSAGTGLANTRLQVTATSGGAITGIEIIGTGSYSTIIPGPYELFYAFPNVGSGIDALVQIDWSCQSIKFTTPPASSAVTNIYVLYIGTTFEPAPTNDSDTIYSGSDFVAPNVTENHPEELYPMRVNDTLMFDTYTSSVGGRPVVSTKVYQTDGISDHYDIGITPEDEAAISVYLGGVLQVYGLSGNYIVNYVTNSVVFITPPAAGQLLRISAIAVGGGSRSISEVFVSNSGSGYSPYDIITLTGGTGTQATIQLNTVQAVYASVNTPGTGYQVNDELILVGGTVPSTSLAASFSVSNIIVVGANVNVTGANYRVNDTLTFDNIGFISPAILKVSSVGLGGEVTGLQVINHGLFGRTNADTVGLIPSSQTSIEGYGVSVNIDWGIGNVSLVSSGQYSDITVPPSQILSTGTGGTLIVSYGAETATVLNPGLYTGIPSQPISQGSVSPSLGVGATWNSIFTKRLETYVFPVTSSQSVFSVPGITASYPEGIIVTVDGIVTTFSRATNAIALFSPANIGSTVIVTTFNSSQFSTITETALTISNSSVLTYQLTNQYPGSSQPNYLGTLVRQNGNLMAPALMQDILGNGFTRNWPITIDITSGTVLAVNVFVDSIPQVNTVDYNIVTVSNSSVITFTYSPVLNSLITIECIRDTTNYSIALSGGIPYITFTSNVISNGDSIIVTSYTQDADYGFRTEQFPGHGPGWDEDGWDSYDWDTTISNSFRLASIPWDISSITVWVNNILQTPMYDYIITNVDSNSGWASDPWDMQPFDEDVDNYVEIQFGGNIAVDAEDTVIVNYMTGLPEQPAIAWRTLISPTTIDSIAIDDNRKTFIISNVYTYSTSIEIEDYRTVSVPIKNQPQYVYINGELIGYYTLTQAPSIQYPYRAFLNDIQRNLKGTSGDPENLYNCDFFDGDGVTVYFPTEAAGQALAETFFVNEVVQRLNIDYTVQINPQSLPAGRYFKLITPPDVGYKNVKIVSLNYSYIGVFLSHIALSEVIDAGSYTTIPGGYVWEAAPQGLQYNNSALSTFLLNHSGTSG